LVAGSNPASSTNIKLNNMTITFKNGTKHTISLEIASVLKQRILEGANKFQIFSDDRGTPVLIINLEEVILIS
jgi:hypothetical protein